MSSSARDEAAGSRASEGAPHESAATYRVGVLVIHLTILAICTFLFCNHVEIFTSYDGNNQLVMMGLEHVWTPADLSWSATPFAGMGNIFSCSFNYHFSPACKLAMVLGNGAANRTLVYLFVLVQAFVAMVLLGRLLGIAALPTYGAAWLVTLIYLPSGIQMPVFLEFNLLWCLAASMFWQIGSHGRIGALACTLLALMLIIWCIILAPGLVLLAGPLGLTCCLAALIPATRLQRRWRITAMAAIVLVLLPSAIPFVSGNFVFSAPAFFQNELLQRYQKQWHYVSFFFQRNRDTDREISAYIVCVGLLGATYALRYCRGSTRVLAAFLLTNWVAIVGLGYLVLFRTKINAAPPYYYEGQLLPFFAIFAAWLVTDTCRLIFSRLAPLVPILPIRRLALGWLALPLACLVWLPFKKPLPPPQQFREKPPLVARLQEQIGLTPGKKYRGSVATFTGYERTQQVSWDDLMFKHDFEYVARLGNDHRTAGLWLHQIPTLFEYNAFMTPTYYAALSRLLARPQDQQARNFIVLTKPKFPYLRSLGIRFVVTDFAVTNDDVPVSSRPSSTPRLVEKCLLDNDSNRWLYLYELDDANLGNYSPTRLRVVPTAQEMLADLGGADFDFRGEAVVAEALPETLVPADQVELSVHSGYMEIKASSSGTSLLLLPIQYSHCLELEPLSAAGTAARLERVNFLQAGLIFSGRFEGRIRFAYGPFHNPYGRWRDYWDMKTLKLGELAQQHNR